VFVDDFFYVYEYLCIHRHIVHEYISEYKNARIYKKILILADVTNPKPSKLNKKPTKIKITKTICFRTNSYVFKTSHIKFSAHISMR